MTTALTPPPFYESSVPNVSEGWVAVEPLQHGPKPAGPLHTYDVFGRLIFMNRARNRFRDDFEFAGWGSCTQIKLTDEDHQAGQIRLQNLRRKRTLGQYTASALAGNAVLGSVFYALPAVVAVSSVYSPISLFIATLVIFIWRPIMQELASAFPIGGAPYTYILNISGKPFALIGAILLLLDFSSTSIVSAATAATYVAGEVSLPFPTFVGTIFVLVLFMVISLTGVKESARIALVVLTFHMGTMLALIIASMVQWKKIGNEQLEINWQLGKATTSGAAIRSVFNGFCLGMLGLTGFECIPAYIARIKPGKYPLVLRNLHIPAIILNTTIMTLVIATIPLDTILTGANILSILAQQSAGRWLRVWVVIDAFIVLCGGVLTGILSACELLEQLASHRILPNLFLNTIPATGSPYLSVLLFTGFCGILYASAGASLNIISSMFSLVWLTVMALFPISLLLLKFNRGRLGRNFQTPLLVYFSIYFFGIMAIFQTTQNKIYLLRWVYWFYDQYLYLHTFKYTSNWATKLPNLMISLRRQTVCILAKTDEINRLFHMVLYVQQNEETAHLKIIHFNEDEEEGIPSELEANAKSPLDEAFPEITIDLLIVHGNFEPSTIGGVAHHLKIPTSLMFMSCPGPDFPYSVAELGTRIIVL
ncbi:amino acid permease-domain-containing protein [Infundibulicybe gibba]|nr:amino acid permease-domain-containing protein [Infundibulicybe gibba]